MISALDLFGDRVFACSLRQKEVDLVAGRIMHLREGEFQLEGEIRLRVCWRRIAEKTKETSSKEINFLSLAFAEAELQI